MFFEGIKMTHETIEEIERLLDHDKSMIKKDTLIDFDEDIPDNLKLNDNDELNIPVTDPDEIKKLLDYDKPEGCSILEELDGAVHSDDVSSSVDLKKNIYK